MSQQQLAAAYSLVWETFCAGSSTADGRHDTPSWRAHSGPFALCVVRLSVPTVQPALDRLRTDLQGVAGLRLHPDHFLHVTLQELGFVVDSPTHPDELTPARLEEFAQSAVGPAAAAPPFALRLGGVNSFEDAVFLEVHEAGRLLQIHEQLFDLAIVPGRPAFPYLPHCTLGHYDGTASVEAAVMAIAPWREAILGELVVEEIEIVTLDPSQPYPPLESYAVIPLGG
jgi:RNA 2',3'-cyclic 3'-phosphodiesterase